MLLRAPVSPQTHPTRGGFTLIEMIVAILALSIIVALGGLALGNAFDSYKLLRDASDIGWQGRVALERMTRELRDIRSATGTDLSFTGTNPMTQIQFFTVDGSGVCFYLGGATVMRSADGPGTACGTTNPQPLADNAAPNGLNFYYYDPAGNNPASVTAVYYVTVTFGVQESGVSETYRVSVYPREF